MRWRGGCYRPSSLSAIRSLPTRVDPVQLDTALRAWHEAQGGADDGLAIDGKTIRGAIDADGNRVHVLGITGHDGKATHGVKNPQPADRGWPYLNWPSFNRQ